MRRRPEDEDHAARGASASSRLEERLGGFLRRHPRLPVIVLAALAGLIVLAVVLSKLAHRHP